MTRPSMYISAWLTISVNVQFKSLMTYDMCVSILNLLIIIDFNCRGKDPPSVSKDRIYNVRCNTDGFQDDDCVSHPTRFNVRKTRIGKTGMYPLLALW